MTSTLEVLFLRRPAIDYISPAICEADFSSSAHPVIVLDPFSRLFAPSGFALGGDGSIHTFVWNRYPGVLCYSVYKLIDELDPNGAYQLIAECITDNFYDTDIPGTYRITAITSDGETPFSDPLLLPNPTPPPPVFDPPFVWWPMEEASGVRIDVIQGLGLIPAGGSEAQVVGKVVKAGSIPVANYPINYFGCSFASLVYTTGVSIVGWIKPELTTTICDTGIYFGSGFINLRHSFSTNQIDAEVVKGASFSDIIAPGPGNLNEWSFFVLTYDAVTGKIGARINNGAFVESPAGVILGTLTFPTVKCIPDVGGISLDEFAVFTRKLTTDEMDTLYNSGNGTTWPLT
jgi:hypothetical protein